MGYIALLIYSLGFLVSLEGEIRKYPEGDALYRGIANGTRGVLQWRALANPGDEMRGIQSFLGWIAAAAAVPLVIALIAFPHQLPPSVILATVGAIGIWFSFRTFHNLKEFFLGWLARIALFAASPLVMYAVTAAYGETFHVPTGFRQVAEHLGVGMLEPWHYPALLSIIAGIGGIIYLLAATAALLSAPLLVFLLLKASSYTSSRFLPNHNWIWFRRALFYYFIGCTVYWAYLAFLG